MTSVKSLANAIEENWRVSNAWCMYAWGRPIDPLASMETSRRLEKKTIEYLDWSLQKWDIVLASTGRQVVRYVCELLLLHAGLTMTRVTLDWKRISLDRQCGSRTPTDNAKIFSSWYGVEIEDRCISCVNQSKRGNLVRQELRKAQFSRKTKRESNDSWMNMILLGMTTLATCQLVEITCPISTICTINRFLIWVWTMNVHCLMVFLMMWIATERGSNPLSLLFRPFFGCFSEITHHNRKNAPIVYTTIHHEKF